MLTVGLGSLSDSNKVLEIVVSLTDFLFAPAALFNQVNKVGADCMHLLDSVQS